MLGHATDSLLGDQDSSDTPSPTIGCYDSPETLSLCSNQELRQLLEEETPTLRLPETNTLFTTTSLLQDIDDLKLNSLKPIMAAPSLASLPDVNAFERSTTSKKSARVNRSRNQSGNSGVKENNHPQSESSESGLWTRVASAADISTPEPQHTGFAPNNEHPTVSPPPENGTPNSNKKKQSSPKKPIDQPLERRTSARQAAQQNN
ncbi:hypothetical protein HK102_006846, partial [Quaeritorhiza haematococci]